MSELLKERDRIHEIVMKNLYKICPTKTFKYIYKLQNT